MLLNEIDAAVEADLKHFFANGAFRRYTDQYSEQLAEQLVQRFAARDVLLTSSGTAAVELALRAAGIGQGDEVLISAYDYPGNFWAIERVGAMPVLMDIENAGWNVEPQAIATACEARSPALKAMIVSHLHGQLQDIVALRTICEAHGIFLVEDACQAIGASIADRPVGSVGHASVLSFGGSKVISAGRGGALLTSDASIAQHARIAAGAGSGSFTMSEMQSAVVLAQLKWLDAILETCRGYFGKLIQCLPQDSGISMPFAACLQHTSFYQAGLLCREAAIQTKLIESLRASGIPAGAGFPGFHRRSLRRCRPLVPLAQIAVTASRTITVHHSLAMQNKISAEQLAAMIISRLSGL